MNPHETEAEELIKRFGTNHALEVAYQRFDAARDTKHESYTRRVVDYIETVIMRKW